MEKSELVDLLVSLIQLDIDAIRAYSEALDACTDADVVQSLTAFRADHQRHVDELGAVVRRLGDEPPSPSPDLMGFLIEGMTAIRALLGEGQALLAMRQNEQLTNRRYDAALQHPAIPEDIRAILVRNRDDERRHLTWIQTRVSQGVTA